MGLQSFSEKSVRKVRRQFPLLDIEAIRVRHDGVWLHCRTSKDEHFVLNRHSGETQEDTLNGQTIHWTSCRKGSDAS